MKKLIGTVAALLLVASAAFADISFGAWLRVLGTPIASDGDETIYAGTSNSWGGQGRAARLDISMTSEDGKAGFNFGLFDELPGSSFSDGGTCALWVRPIDMLKVTLGKVDYTRVRSDFCFGSWDWLRANNAVAWGEGITFPQLGNQSGILLELEPIDGLLVMWNLPMGQLGKDTEAYEVFEQQHIAATYAIENIGKIHLGWKGNGGRKYSGNAGNAAGWYEGGDPTKGTASLADATAIDWTSPEITVGGKKYKWVDEAKPSGDEYKYLGDICAAFDLTAVENLYVTVGGHVAIASSDYKDKVGDGFQVAQVALGASYAVMDNFKVYADFATAIYKGNDPAMGFGIGLDYGVMDNLTLNVDFRGLIPNNDADPDFSFLIGAKYACSSNGYIGIAFQGFIAGEKSIMGDDTYKPVQPAKADKFSFAVPIAVSVWF